jgi:FkbM family methyltransferase
MVERKLYLLRWLRKVGLLRSRKIQAILKELKKNTDLELTVSSRYGFKVHCDMKEWIDGHIFFYGEYEKRESRFVSHILKSGDVFFDVGANIGYYSMLASSRGCAVHAFEPVPSTYERLKANAELNRYEWTCQNMGVSDQCGEIKIFMSPDTIGNNSADIVYDPDDYVLCEMETIDNYCEERGIEEIDFLKVDVEGHEMKVLEGARRLLLSNGIGMILVEVKGINLSPALKDLMLERFQPYIFGKNGIEKVDEMIETNLLLVRRTGPELL